MAFQEIALIIAFWLYFANAILLICHEIESAYWKEWELFKMKGGITLFVIFHIPLLGLIFYGMIEFYLASIIGAIFSFVLSLGGIFAFSIHTYFIKKGNEEFTLPISKILLYGLLVISVLQIIFTILAATVPIVVHCGLC
ncbi:MAG: DUF6713 family protein [Candidatus Thorarchaeota archaeon]